MLRTYTELSRLQTLEERFEYLKLNGRVGSDTFGFDRYLNQAFYKSPEWLAVRNEVIVRDNGNELGCEGYPIGGLIIIHHMNPITIDDILNRNPEILNPEYLISVSDLLHKAVHYGNAELLPRGPVVRYPGDTCPWK